MSHLKEVRKKLGLSQGELAEQLGVSQATMSNMEKNMESVLPKYLLFLYKKHNVSPLYIIAGEGDMFVGDSKEKISLLIKQLQAEIDNL